MTIKLPPFLFLMFAAFSMDNENEEQTALQLKKKSNKNWGKKLQKIAQVKRKLEKNSKKPVIDSASEKILGKKTYSGLEKAFGPTFLVLLKQELEQRAQDLQKQEDILQKRVKAAERTLEAREENLRLREQYFKTLEVQKLQKEESIQEREQDLAAVEERLNAREERLRLQEQLLQQMELSLCERKVEFTGPHNLYPNESSIKVLCDLETTEFSWEDPNELIPNEIKEDIVCSIKQGESEKSNGLFDCISNWYVPVSNSLSSCEANKLYQSRADEAKPFFMELMFALCSNVDLDKRSKKMLTTPLMHGSYFDSEEVVVKLIERGVDLEAVDNQGNSALHWAASRGSLSCCKVLLKNGANINGQTRNGEISSLRQGNTPVHFAALNGHVEVVKFLLESGADAKIKNRRGFTPFSNSKPNCAKVILNHESKFKEKI